MSERVPSLSLSTDVYGSYCLQILDNIVSEYTVTEDSILRRFECNLETNEFLSYERFTIFILSQNKQYHDYGFTIRAADCTY